MFLEGIPYLRDAVAYSTVALTVIVAVSFAISTFILRCSRNFIINKPKAHRSSEKNVICSQSKHDKNAKEINSLMKKVFVKNRFTSIVLPPAIFGFVLLLWLKTQEVQEAEKFALFGFIYTLMASLIVWKDKLIWFFAVIVTIATLLISVGTAFNPPYYAAFLRLCKYGGGFPITIAVADDANVKTTNLPVYLVLRTPESYIVYNKELEQIEEYQVKNYSISYTVNSSNNYHLPIAKKQT